MDGTTLSEYGAPLHLKPRQTEKTQQTRNRQKGQMIDRQQSIFAWSTSLMKRAKTLILQTSLPSGPQVSPHTSLVMKHCQVPYSMPIIIKSGRFLITTNVEEITILDQGIISFSESLAYINSAPFALKASYWNRYRVFGAQDSCVFKRPDFYQALIRSTAEALRLCFTLFVTQRSQWGGA